MSTIQDPKPLDRMSVSSGRPIKPTAEQARAMRDSGCGLGLQQVAAHLRNQHRIEVLGWLRSRVSDEDGDIGAVLGDLIDLLIEERQS